MKKIYGYTIVAAAAISIVAVGAVLKGCTSNSESEFLDVVEIADEGDSSLPKATEVGCNTAGAYFNVSDPHSQNRQTWTMNYHNESGSPYSPEIRIVNDSLKLYMIGNIKRPYPEVVRIVLTIPNFPIDSLTGLQALSSRGFLMSEKKLSAAIISDRGLSPTKGNPIVIKDATLGMARCRSIYRNETKLVGVNVAGKFTIKGVAADTINVTIESGRFDLMFKSRDTNGVFRW